MNAKPQVNPPVRQEPSTPRATAGVDTLSPAAPRNVTEHQRFVALQWVSRGVPVVPCGRDKRPLVAGFGAGASEEELAPFSDPETVRSWWSARYARAHVGLLTGRGPGRGLLVVDLDMPKGEARPLTGRWEGCQGGTDVLELLAAESGAPWPETYTVLTPGGGMHLYFLQPEEGPLIGCATGDGPTAPHLGPLVDVRGVGGVIIAAGSYAAVQGRPYERVSPPELLPQPLPGWLLALLRRPAAPPSPPPAPAVVRSLPTGSSRAERYAAAAFRGEVEEVSAEPEGGRNQRLFRAARKLGELSATAPAVLDTTTVEEQLLAAALRCGLREREALATIRSGWAHGTAGAGLGGAA
ncbi:bifunctional DNA primase/polymerase [Streptomyces pini]|uniref:Bifunctional DNA primase/polymerase, N-terminal n=1 Tax=Streptomyces pini TaxID=1520580 RepID=A0A1I4MEG4_9ACTN|nr:bifunctional DNA primase/polymerase [Streptomyces pini]SFM01658.1 Bifunctional DNA primase/polymerase, N-terminal [Streptomyces pini]